jgi:hypothetical protein
VVYLDGDCDNMFGWGDFLFWPQVELLTERTSFCHTLTNSSLSITIPPQLSNGNGTLYGWDLSTRSLIFASVGLGPGSIWGKAVGINPMASTQRNARAQLYL